MRTFLLLAVGCLTWAACSASSLAEEKALTLNKFVEADTDSIFTYQAEGPGVLTLVVRSNSDVVINVTSAAGGPVAGGRIDIDFEGNGGAEQGAVVLPTKGNYKVTVQPFDPGQGLAVYHIGASFFGAPLLAGMAPVDPATAPALEAGKVVDGKLPAGRNGTLYVYKAKSNGVLTVDVQADCDVILTSFLGDLQNVGTRADDDLNGDTGHESITLDVREGQTYFFAITPFGGAAAEANLKIRTELGNQ